MELGRSKRRRAVPASFGALVSVLVDSAQFEREGLRDTISQLLRTAEVIALDGAILHSAAEIQVEFGMSGQDAIVQSSILAHLDRHNLMRVASSTGIQRISMTLMFARGSKFAGASSL